MEKETGFVKYYNRKLGYGFITNDETGIETFVHWSGINMDGFRYLNQMDKVTYVIEEWEKVTKAIDVTVIERSKILQRRKKHIDKAKNTNTEKTEVVA